MGQLALRGLYLGAILAYAGVVLVVSLALPDRVPLHFDGSGSADRYGSRTEAVLVFVGTGILILAVFATCAWAVRRASLQWFNVPHKRWWTATPEREAVLRGRVATDLDVLAIATLLLLTVVVAMVGRAARDDVGLGAGAWVALGLYLVFVAGWSAWAMTTRYRPDPEQDGTVG